MFFNFSVSNMGMAFSKTVYWCNGAPLRHFPKRCNGAALCHFRRRCNGAMMRHYNIFCLAQPRCALVEPRCTFASTCQKSTKADGVTTRFGKCRPWWQQDSSRKKSEGPHESIRSAKAHVLASRFRAFYSQESGPIPCSHHPDVPASNPDMPEYRKSSTWFSLIIVE